LKKIHLSPSFHSFGNDEMKRVVTLIKKNYVLTELDKCLTEREETGGRGSVLRLKPSGTSLSDCRRGIDFERRRGLG
jgi:hypothetical protein